MNNGDQIANSSCKKSANTKLLQILRTDNLHATGSVAGVAPRFDASAARFGALRTASLFTRQTRKKHTHFIAKFAVRTPLAPTRDSPRTANLHGMKGIGVVIGKAKSKSQK